MALERIVPAGSLLPRAPLVNLETNHDEYQRVAKGKVLLVFVTTDCDACRKELSNLSQVAPSLASRITVYGVGIEDRDSVKTFIDANPVGFPILLDHGAAILSSLGFRIMPTKVLVQDGVIGKIWYGSSPNTNALIKDVG
jgi:peroxiredoxin